MPPFHDATRIARARSAEIVCCERARGPADYDMRHRGDLQVEEPDSRKTPRNDRLHGIWIGSRNTSPISNHLLPPGLARGLDKGFLGQPSR